MMNATQILHNTDCEVMANSISAQIVEGGFTEWRKFRYCSAETSCNWYGIHLLKSYNTIVAAYDEETGVGYDFLRFTYGYTPTSAQHISKFFKIYQPTTIYTWRRLS